MDNKHDEGTLLKKINVLEHELEELKRTIISSLSWKKKKQHAVKPTLFGSVRGGDITEQMIDDAKNNVLRNIEDIQDIQGDTP